MKNDSFMNSINKFIDKKIEQRYSNVAYGRSLFRDGDYDIVIGSTEDAMVIEFKDETLVKLAIGFVTDITGAYAEPGIVFGSGNAYGDNRGFITKDTDSLNLYYIGDLSEGEVAGFAIYKDKIESTVPITVNAGLAGEFILDATNWAAKLTEADAKTIVENPSKGWQIASENLVNADVASWAAGGTGAAAVSIINAALNIVSDLPSAVTQGTFGIKAQVDSTHYATLTGNGLEIVGGALSILSTAGDLMMSGAGIIANQIIAGTMTGFTIQTAASGSDRIEISSNGIKSYTADGKKNGLYVDTGLLDLKMYYNDTAIFTVLNNLDDSASLLFNGNSIGYGYSGGFLAYNNWSFTNATVTGLSAVWG